MVSGRRLRRSGRRCCAGSLDAVPLARARWRPTCGSSWSPARGSTRRRCRADAVPTVRGYVPDLHGTWRPATSRVVQGGLTTCMELTAARRPFVYVPLRNHFEQNLHVRHRLSATAPGTHLPYEQPSTPTRSGAELLADRWPGR